MSVVLFRYFCCFGPFMSPLFFPSYDGVKAAHSDFNSCQLGGGLRPENPYDQNFFRPQLRLCDPCTHTNVSSSKILAHYAENEHFPPQILRSLLSAAPCDNQNRHSRGKGLGPRSNFALPRVVKSINVHYLSHPPCSILPINQ